MAENKHDVTFNRALILGREMDYVQRSVSEMHISGDGPFSGACGRLLADELQAASVQLTTSCTAALEMCALLLDLEPGDEVIVPSYGFVSITNAIALRGATPIFADVRPETLNLDERQLDALRTERTKAVLVIHYSGVACKVETLEPWCRSHGIDLIEDNAHGLFASYHGRPLGSWGRFSTLSFHETKNLSCGEGGALVINREEDVQRAEWIRDKGTNRQQLFRGEVDKYTWVDLGSSYVLSDMLAAFLLGQLEQRDRVEEARQAIWERYDAAFRPALERNGVQLPHLPDGVVGANHMYWMMLPDLETRSRLIAHLRGQGVVAVSHYQPLNASKMGQQFGGRPGSCPVTERAGECLMRLPFYNDLSVDDQQRVIDGVLGFDY